MNSDDVLARIARLREQSRDPDFCQGVLETQFDDMVSLLLHRSDPHYPQSVDLIAAISNVLLINRDLHSHYFTARYSNKLLAYVDELISAHLPASPHDAFDFVQLVPLYRLLFLILYDGIADVNDDVVSTTYTLLILGFKFCDGAFARFKDDIHYKMTFTEILKSLYTLNHNYRYGGELLRKEHLAGSVVYTVNEIFKYRPQPSTFSKPGTILLRSLLNFLLGIFHVNHTVLYFEESNQAEAETFLNHLLTLLNYELTQPPDYDISDLNNLMIILNYILAQLQGFSALHAHLARGILPRHSKEVYTHLLRLMVATDYSTSHTRSIILQLFYNCTWNESHDTHIVDFLLVAGYLNAETFMAENDIKLPAIDIRPYLYPNPKFVDASLNIAELRPQCSLNSIFDQTSTLSAPSDMTQEEKEREADKLFHIFDRMEKTGVFQNFKNPVREWQQLGRFEDIE